MLAALCVMAGIAVVIGAVLGYASLRFRVEGNPLIEKIDAVLPQSQCGQCGYAGCKPYAEAVAKGEAPPTLCVPGGPVVAKAVAELAGIAYEPPQGTGEEAPPKTVAFINENLCIGCTACAKVCPVDAIVGSSKRMHTVITALCTGCGKCEPVCPVADCIVMEPVPADIATWKWPAPPGEARKAA
jgi:electron transport complex protein RnfB